MRPSISGCGDIGDSVDLAMVGGGVLDEIGSVRTYNAVNPFDIGAGTPPEQSFALFPCFNANSPIAASMPDVQYPMTFHQRLYLWPKVGPVRLAGSPSVDVSNPPNEVPVGQDQWSICPITVIPPNRISDETMPLTGGQSLITETALPQRGNSTREFWTFYGTMPWAPTAIIKNNIYGGDTGKFLITGVTRDNAGAALGNCNVTVLKTDKLIANNFDPYATPVVATTTSDGSGNFSLQVNDKGPFTVLAYKAGSPDKAGISLSSVVPVAG